MPVPLLFPSCKQWSWLWVCSKKKKKKNSPWLKVVNLRFSLYSKNCQNNWSIGTLVTVLWYCIWNKRYVFDPTSPKNISLDLFSFQVLSEHFDIKHWNVSKVLQLDSSSQHKECKQLKKSCFMCAKNIRSQYHLDKASCCFNSLCFNMDKTDDGKIWKGY